MVRTPIHPGEILREELDELDMSAAELARQLNIPTNRITGVLNGQRAVTADTALRLGHWFGTGPEFWLTMQVRYELALAERRAGNEINRLPISTFGPLPRSRTGPILLDHFGGDPLPPDPNWKSRYGSGYHEAIRDLSKRIHRAKESKK